MQDESRTGNTPSHIVAIGASAGGLEALESLFDVTFSPKIKP